MTYRGKVQRGAIVPENGADLPKGTLVRIELLLGEELAPESANDPLLEMTSLAVETGLQTWPPTSITISTGIRQMRLLKKDFRS